MSDACQVTGAKYNAQVSQEIIFKFSIEYMPLNKFHFK